MTNNRSPHHSDSETPEPTPRHGPEHERLGVFVGTWRTEGETYRPAARLAGQETFEWLPGGFFLVDRFDRRIGDGEHRGLGVMGWDAADGAYFTCLYDNLGFARTYRTTVEDRLWTLTGERERATFRFSDGGTSFAAHWDQSKDGTQWAPLCDFTATKAV